MNPNWIVVADNSRARIFSADTPNSPLTEIATLAHPEARLHEGDLVSDQPGREHNPVSMSHDLGSESDAKHEEAVRFAGQVCQTLEHARNDGRFDELYIIAAPAFLGIMRKHEPSPLKQRVAGEVAKNMAGHSVADIRKCLPARL
ncbi:MAG: host attachment protein [Candidatus Sedimenticola sp. (ex Thyasira tokunagai)]